jgi:hypothetical protein
MTIPLLFHNEPGPQTSVVSMGTIVEWSARKIRRVPSLRFADWGYLAIASIELFAARIRFSIVGAETILRELQAPLPKFNRNQREPLTRIGVQRLSWAMKVAAQFVPWRSDCLIQVMAADRWLRRRHLRPDFYLGVTKDERGIFTAHAWVRCGDITVTGGRYDRFSTLIEPVVKHAAFALRGSSSTAGAAGRQNGN